MLSTMRQSWLLFALFALIACSHALNLDNFHIDGINAYLHHGKRQEPSGTGNTPSPTPSPTPSDDPEPSSTPEPSPTPTPSPSDDPKPSDTPKPTPTPSPSPSDNEPTPSPPQTPGSTPASSTPASTPPPSKTSKVTTPVVKTTPLVATSVGEFITIYTTINNAGETQELTSTGHSTALITTGTALVTETPLPQNGSNDDNGGGLSDSKKKIIGGVVGGVGGAILLGGIAIACWRIWGRKKRITEDDADIMAGTGAALGDKPHSSSSPPPYGDRYQAPTGRPNAAANF